MANFIPTVQKGQINQSSRFEDTSFGIKTAKIIRVDNERMVCDVAYLDSTGTAPKIDITSAYGGFRSFLGAMPKVNDWVLIGMHKAGNFYYPYILQYLPRGHEYALAHDLLNVPSAFASNNIATQERFKTHKLYEGEIYGTSTQGSELLMDKNILLSNSKLNEIYLNSADQSINLSAVNTYINNAGVRLRSGIIYRNNLIEDPNFQNSPGNSKFPVFYNEEGMPKYAAVWSETINADNPYGTDSLDDDVPGFMEHRIEVKEMERPLTPVTESNSGVETDNIYTEKLNGDSNKPLVVQVLGTLVGNDSVGDLERYGVILKPKIFSSQTDGKGSLTEEACVVQDNIDETTSLAAAYTLKFPNSGTAFYVNKQGKLFLNVASSSEADALGSGESAEINLSGHSKLYLGKNSSGRSMTLMTDGGISTNFGVSNDGASRSWDAQFRSGVYWNITGKDKDGNSLRIDASADVRASITGSRYTEIKGDDIRLVHGTLEDRVLGKKVDNFVNDKATTYGGSYSETSVGHYSQVMASGRSVTIYGPDVTAGETNADSTEVLVGNVSTSIGLGSRTDSIKVGNYTTEIIAGERSINITAGNYSISIVAGNIDISTVAGEVSVGTDAGTVQISGTLGVSIKSAVSVSLDAPQVSVGGLPQGGIVTDKLMKCYFTGAPLLGSATATCNMF